MKKFLKITFSTIFILIILILSTPFIFKNKLLEITKEQINLRVDAKVAFDFDVSIIDNFPDLTVTLSNFEIVGERSFAKDTLIFMNELEATVDIMSVISSDQIDVKSVILESPRIHAIILEGGTANYDIYKSDDTDTIEEVDTTESSFALQLENIEIRNAYIEYDDKAYNMYSLIAGFNMQISGDFTASSTVLKTNTSIENFTYKMDGISYMKNASVSLDANIDANFDEEKYALKENKMIINALELAYDGWLQFDGDDIIMDFTYSAPKTDFKEILSLVPGVFMEGFDDIQTTGKLAFNGNIKGRYAESPETYPSFNLELLVENGTFKYPDLPKSVDNINAELHINNPASDLDSMIIDLSKFTVSFADNPFSMNFLMKYPMSDSYMKAKMAGKIDLNTMGDFIPLDSITMKGIITPDIEFASFLSDIEKEDYDAIKAIGKLGVSDFTYIDNDFPQGVFINSMNMTFTPQFVDLENCELKIGKSDMSFSGKLENFIPYALADDTISGSLNFYSSYLDGNEFYEDNEEITSTDTATEAYELIEVPGNIDFVLQTKIDRLLYDTYDIENLEGVLAIKDSKVDMKNLKMNMLEGTLGLSGFYSTPKGGEPSAFFDMDMQHFNIVRSYETFVTMQKIAPIAKYCTGFFSTKLTFNSKLEQDFMPVLSSINGSGYLSTQTISIKGSKVQNLMATALKQDNLKTISSNDLLMQFEIIDGNLVIQPFDTELNNKKARIAGKSGLDQTIEYTIDMQIPKSDLGAASTKVIDGLVASAANKGINAEVGDMIPVKFVVTGTITNPKVKPVLSENNVFTSVKDQAAAKAKAEYEKAKKEAEAKALEAKRKAEAEARKKAEEVKKKAQEEAQKKATEVKDKAKDAAKKQIKGFINK